MFRKAFVSITAAVAFGFGVAGMTAISDARHEGTFHSRADHYAYPDYYERNYGFRDCRYRWITVKQWNKAHTKRIKVKKKRWVCY